MATATVAARFGDQAFLAHALGQQHLADAVVHLVRASVVELFTLEEDFCPATVLGQALGEVQRVRAADVVALEVGQLFEELRVGLGGFVFAGQVQYQWHQGFCHVAAAERAEQAVGVWARAVLSLGHGALQGVMNE